jgi:hypothetical protein
MRVQSCSRSFVWFRGSYNYEWKIAIHEITRKNPNQCRLSLFGLGDLQITDYRRLF